MFKNLRCRTFLLAHYGSALLIYSKRTGGMFFGPALMAE